MQEYEEEIYNELNEYLNHQESYCLEHLGEQTYFAIKEELDGE